MEDNQLLNTILRPQVTNARVITVFYLFRFSQQATHKCGSSVGLPHKATFTRSPLAEVELFVSCVIRIDWLCVLADLFASLEPRNSLQ